MSVALSTQTRAILHKNAFFLSGKRILGEEISHFGCSSHGSREMTRSWEDTWKRKICLQIISFLKKVIFYQVLQQIRPLLYVEEDGVCALVPVIFEKEEKSSDPKLFFWVLQPFSTHFVASLLASSLSAAATVTPRLDSYF